MKLIYPVIITQTDKDSFFVHFYALKKCFGTQRISSGSSREGGKWSVKAPNTNAFIKHNRRCRYESKSHTKMQRMQAA